MTLEVGIDPLGRARIKSGAQHQELAVAQMRQKAVDALLNGFSLRIEKFVDRSADGDDDRPIARNFRRPAGEQEAVLLQRLRKQTLRAMLDEGKASGLERRQTVLIDVVDVDGQPSGGERQNQRDAHVSAAAHDRQVRQGRGCHGLRKISHVGDFQRTSPCFGELTKSLEMAAI